MTPTFETGDRVEHVLIGCKGTIKSADERGVRVLWDDDQRVGRLYHDRTEISSTRFLLKLPPRRRR